MGKILDRFTVNFNRRVSGKNRPLSSDIWNASISELSADIGFIQKEWNNKLVVLLEDLPAGDLDTTVNAYKFGLSGAHMWMDADATSATSGGFFWNTAKDRPRTVKEVALKLSSDVSAAITTMRSELAASTATLTAAEKARIGDNVFDSSRASLATSLDGLTSSNKQNVIQLAKDLYGIGNYTLIGDGAALLTNSVRAHIEAILALHGGTWDSDLTLAHSIDLTSEVTGLLPQTSVRESTSVSDTYTGASTNLLHDLNRIRSMIRQVTNSGVAWTTGITPDSSWSGSGQPLHLQNIFDLSGTAANKTSTNPWAYTIDDLENGTTFASSVLSFTGMSSRSDGSPTYSSTDIVTNGDSLETAIGKLDAAMLDSVAATGVSIADAGGYFDATNVETALQYLGSGVNNSLDAQGYRSFAAVGLEAITTMAKVVTDSGLYVESTTASDPWTGFMCISLPDNIRINSFSAVGHKGAASNSGVDVKLIKVPSDRLTLSTAYTLFDVTLTDVVLGTQTDTISSGLTIDSQTESLVVYFNRQSGGANYPPAQLVNFTVGYVPIGLIL